MSDIAHECGIAAVYHLPGEAHPLCPEGGPEEIASYVQTTSRPRRSSTMAIGAVPCIVPAKRGGDAVAYSAPIG